MMPPKKQPRQRPQRLPDGNVAQSERRELVGVGRKKLPPLTPRQREFVDQYVACGHNPRLAARKMGLAGSTGYSMLRRPQVRAEITRMDAERYQGAMIARDELGYHLMEIMRTPIGTFLAEDGTIDVEAVRAAGPVVRDYMVTEHLNKDGEVSTRRTKIRLADNIRAAELLAKLYALNLEEPPAVNNVIVLGLSEWVGQRRQQQDARGDAVEAQIVEEDEEDEQQ